MSRLRTLGERIYFLTFRVRTLILLSLVIMGIIPGTFITSLPSTARWVYAYVFVIFTLAATYSFTNVITVQVKQMVGLAIYSRKYKPEKYSTSKLQQLQKNMGFKKEVEVFVTDNPWASSPFANLFTGKICLPKDWVDALHESEILSTIGHELGHLKTRSKYFLETVTILSILIAFTIWLSFFTLQIICQVTAFALEMLLFTYISRRNEYRADLLGAKYAGPEGLISVFTWLQTSMKRDEGSETHPSLGSRIEKLNALLDSPSNSADEKEH